MPTEDESLRSTADSRMFADFARKSIAVCVSSIKVVYEMSPSGVENGPSWPLV